MTRLMHLRECLAEKCMNLPLLETPIPVLQRLRMQ
jgi:hypothetical protein